VKPSTFIQVGIVPALGLLPKQMDSPAAKAMIIAICLQESRLEHRRQISGPARGYPQFEMGGIRGVLKHPASAPHAVMLCADLDCEAKVDAVYTAIEYSDVIAAGFARLLLWTLPDPLPAQHETEEGWRQYLDAWRPGLPHRETWNAFFDLAWEMVG